MSNAINGTVKFFDQEKGFGFIRTAQGDMFIHMSVCDGRSAELVDDAVVEVDYTTRYVDGAYKSEVTELISVEPPKEPEEVFAIVKFFNEQKNFGYVICQGALTGIEAFLHGSVVKAAGVTPGTNMPVKAMVKVTGDDARVVSFQWGPEIEAQYWASIVPEGEESEVSVSESKVLEVGYVGVGTIAFVGKGFYKVSVPGYDQVFVPFSASKVRVRRKDEVELEVTKVGKKGARGKIIGKHSSKDGVAGEVAPAPAEAEAPTGAEASMETEAPAEVTVGQLRARKGMLTKAVNSGDEDAINTATVTLQDLIKKALKQGDEVAKAAEQMAKDMGIDTTEAVVLPEPEAAKTPAGGGQLAEGLAGLKAQMDASAELADA